MRSTLEDIAEEAGVTPMTVSNVLRNRAGKTSEQTRQRVLDAASKLRYVPIQTGRQNSHVQTGVIGLVERNFMQVQHPVRLVTFDGIQVGAAEAGYDITLLLRPQPSWIMDGNEAMFLDRRVDGFLVRNVLDLPAMAEAIIRAGIPCVTCYTDSPPPGVGSVTADNEAAVHDAVAHLAALGHRRIAHLTGGSHPDGIARALAFRRCIDEYDLDRSEGLIVEGHWGRRDEIVGVVDVLRSGATAVVCGNGYQALQILDAAIDAGISVPDQLSIVGIDDLEECRFRGLDCLATPFLEIGIEAARMLVERIRQPELPATTKKIRAPLINRKSTARVLVDR